MADLREVQLDGLIAPTHHYGALSFGNKASMRHAGALSKPRAAAHQALDKMAHVMRLGVTQCVLPPLLRPDLDFLRGCGFEGDAAAIMQACAHDDPHLLSLAQSCAFTWTANCATVIPSTDSNDRKCHFVPANLLTTPHRALEGHARYQMLNAIFKDNDQFIIHEPLPMTPALADEGAANHHRCYNPQTEDFAHIFVHSSAHGMPKNLRPQKYPGRQSKEAQISVSRLGHIKKGHSLLITQEPRAIDAGAFHNDVVFAGCNTHILLHEQALIDQQHFISAVESLVPDMHIRVVSKRDLSLDEAVSCYLFNGQFLSTDNGIHLLLPQQCQAKRPKRVVDQLLKDDFIQAVDYLDLSQSMMGGGGPACLRLRIPLLSEEIDALPQSIVLTEDKLQQLKQWVDAHFRDELSTDDLADPQLYSESKTALDALTQLLGTSSLYAFQA